MSKLTESNALEKSINTKTYKSPLSKVGWRSSKTFKTSVLQLLPGGNPDWCSDKSLLFLMCVTIWLQINRSKVLDRAERIHLILLDLLLWKMISVHNRDKQYYLCIWIIKNSASRFVDVILEPRKSRSLICGCFWRRSLKKYYFINLHNRWPSL